MDLKDIAAVSGKSGLYKVIKPTRTGLILETLDEVKGKLIAGATNKVSLLNEISVFTTGEEVSASLATVLVNIHKKYGNSIPVDSKASNNELFDFLAQALPEFDREKVYPSDIKKLVTWYGILTKHAPEKFTEEEPKVEELKETAPPASKKTAAKKDEAETTPKEETKEAKTEKPKAKKEKSANVDATTAEEDATKKPRATKQTTKK